MRRSDLADAIGKGVHGVTYTYKKSEGDDQDPHFGVLADHLSKVMPGVVKKDPGSGMLAVDTGHLSLGNTAVLAELARRIKDLESQRSARHG